MLKAGQPPFYGRIDTVYHRCATAEAAHRLHSGFGLCLAIAYMSDFPRISEGTGSLSCDRTVGVTSYRVGPLTRPFAGSDG